VSRARKALVVAGAGLLLLLGVAAVAFFVWIRPLLRDPFAPVYAESCTSCHGESFEGTAIGVPLVGRDLLHGDSVDDIARSIRTGFERSGMPAFGETLGEGEIRGLAILIAERRASYGRTDFKVETVIVVPAGPIETERATFRLEKVVGGLDPLPFSIAPLPDGRMLVTEKMRGLRIVSPDGSVSPPVEGTPPVHDDALHLASLAYGRGWMLDVAPHPDWVHNGWLYLQFGDRCADCSTSMNKLVRGRLRDGRWVDEETIWKAAPETYTASPDMGAGGRVAFDDRGHVFLSVGIKGTSDSHGIQDLSLPYGKIHRVNEDGSIPDDNPFVGVANALPSTWTYGHRSPQGLEYDAATGRLWSTEMGPRGGDELNLLLPGRNYGWPLTSKGVNYDGTPVAYGKELGIEPDLDAIEQPVVDLTPAPAVSSFVVYHGAAFPGWDGDLIVGTLKATELYRFHLDGDRVIHRELLLRGLARIRDVEVGTDGAIYLLLEAAAGGEIVRMLPEPRHARVP
jgi:glucose/arabinose dehydrogenase